MALSVDVELVASKWPLLQHLDLIYSTPSSRLLLWVSVCLSTLSLQQEPLLVRLLRGRARQCPATPRVLHSRALYVVPMCSLDLSVP